MASPAFSPTTWVNGAAPGISAAKLQAYDDVLDALMNGAATFDGAKTFAGAITPSGGIAGAVTFTGEATHNADIQFDGTDHSLRRSDAVSIFRPGMSARSCVQHFPARPSA